MKKMIMPPMILMANWKNYNNSFLYKQSPRMTMKMWLMKFTAFEN